MKKRYALGVDIGGTSIQFLIMDNTGKEIDYYTNLTESQAGRKKILKNIHNGITYILNKNKNLKIEGIGVGSPGLINNNGKIVTGAANLKQWNGTPLGKILNKSFKLPVFVDNDVTLVALGEAYFGAGKNDENVLCLALGTGLGGGIILNKKVYRGQHGYAGEFGHMIMNPYGLPCTCGKTGCLEAYASTIGIKNLVKKHVTDLNKTKLSKYVSTIDEITPKHVFQAYKKKDKTAEKILDEMSYYLGLGISHLVHVFNPNVIILAGGISQAGNDLIKLAYRYLYKFTLPFYKNNVKIKLSEFKHKSGVIGTASLVFERLNIEIKS